MSSGSDDKCLVCLKAGRNSNIFTTFNMRNDKEELYVEVIKNCFNIEIAPDCGLNALCNECSMKLKKAYNFRHDILQAVEKLISAQVASSNEKQYSEIEYLEDIPFETEYDIDTVLNLETGQVSYALDEIYESKEINETDETNYLLHLDNDAAADKVLLNTINDSVDEDIQNGEIVIDKEYPELHIESSEQCLLDKSVENYKINILSDVFINNDLEPGEIRVIDNTAGHYLIDAKNEVIADKRKIIIKSKGKANVRSKNAVKTIVDKEAGPVNTVEEVAVIEEKDKISKSDIDKICVNKNVRKKVKTVEPNVDKVNAKDLTVDKKKRVSKRIATNIQRDELSLLAQICTGQQNPDENQTANVTNAIHEQKPKDHQVSSMDIDNNDDENASKESKNKKKSKRTVKKEASAKENVSDGAGEVKAKRRKKEKKEKPPAVPFTLQPDQTACDLCSARFETTRALSTHMNAHYPQFECGQCGAQLATKARLRQHLRIHDQGPFACKICDKEFSNSNTRNAHTWRVHSKGDPFKCRHCGARFPTFLQRLRHLQAAHGQAPAYACHFCQATFAYAAYRTKHIRTVHLNERPHACPSCPAAFARARGLAAHRASRHGHGRQPHRCPTCGASFYFRSALRWHASQHRRQFACQQCEQRFAAAGELASHTQIHEHADNMAINLDFATSLQLDALADDYALIDPSYLDLNEL